MPRLLLITILSAALSSCASQQLPPAPVGDTCVVDVANSGAQCVPISQAVQAYFENARLTAQEFSNNVKLLADSFVPFPQMDNYVCFSPATWDNVQAYIGKLKVLAQEKCQP